MICCLCGLFRFLHEGKCTNIQENKYGRIYTSTVPNKTIPFFLLFLCFFLVFGIVLMGKKYLFCINHSNVLILYLRKVIHTYIKKAKYDFLKTFHDSSAQNMIAIS